MRALRKPMEISEETPSPNRSNVVVWRRLRTSACIALAGPLLLTLDSGKVSLKKVGNQERRVKNVLPVES